MNLSQVILKIWSSSDVNLEDSVPLYRRLYELLKINIEQGNLPKGYFLPSSREMSKILSISRSTVNRAFELLIFDGLLTAQMGKGYLIEECFAEVQGTLIDINHENVQLSDLAHSFLEIDSKEDHLSSRLENIGLAFRPGVPAVDIFPVRRWMALTQKYWKDIQFSSLNYKPTSGVQSLKETISNYLRIDRGISCHPEQVIVVSGSLQSLYLIASTMVNSGDQVFAENPTFQNVVSIFKGLRADLCTLDLDDEGAQLPSKIASEKLLKLVHLTPSCQYPLGIEMSESRKRNWIDFAEKNNCYLIENDYEHEIVHYKNKRSTIFSLDSNHNTIYLSTFNRLLHPSIRVGYMVVPFNILPAVEALMKYSHRFVAPSIQMVLDEFIKQSFLQLHIKNIYHVSNERKKAFFKAAHEYLPNWQFTDTPALHMIGSSNTLFDAESGLGVSDKGLSRILQQHNIASQSLSELYFHGPPREGLVLGHSSVPPSVINQKIQHWSALF